jgi:hypothetical protein
MHLASIDKNLKYMLLHCAGKNKYDDVPDGMAMLSEYAQSFVGNKVEIFERLF